MSGRMVPLFARVSRAFKTSGPACIAMLMLLQQAGCGNDSTAGRLPVLSFGSSGLGSGEFNYPRAAAIAPGGALYVVDKAARVQRFSQAGDFELAWRMPEWDAGKPTGLGIGPDGTVYTADTHYSRISIFSPDGKLLRTVGKPGTEPGEFLLPTDIVFAHDGSIYVSEYGGNDRITKFSASWEPLTTFGGRDAGEARLERPQALCMGSDGTLWVADACNHRICHFGPDGEFLGSFGEPGSAVGELRFPYNIEMLSDGTLVVCEYGNNRIQRFTQAGRSLGTWGSAGRRAGELAYPWAFALGARDRLFVIDSGNNRVQAIDGLNAETWTLGVQ